MSPPYHLGFVCNGLSRDNNVWFALLTCKTKYAFYCKKLSLETIYCKTHMDNSHVRRSKHGTDSTAIRLGGIALQGSLPLHTVGAYERKLLTYFFRSCFGCFLPCSSKSGSSCPLLLIWGIAPGIELHRYRHRSQKLLLAWKAQACFHDNIFA